MSRLSRVILAIVLGLPALAVGVVLFANASLIGIVGLVAPVILGTSLWRNRRIEGVTMAYVVSLVLCAALIAFEVGWVMAQPE